jgi:hypothetical protein
MNPLKNLFSKVFETAPPDGAKADASKDNGAFEWNPEEETVAPTSAQGSSWKRGNAADERAAHVPGEATHSDIAASANSLPTPTFEKSPVASSTQSAPTARPSWSEPAVAATVAVEPPSFTAPLPAPPQAVILPPVPPPAVAANRRTDPPPPTARAATSEPATSMAVAAPSAGIANPVIPLSDFEDVYRKAGIKSPVHGYGVERVYRLLTSRRLAGLDRSIRRSALLTALDAAGVPPSDVAQDAVLRRKALTAYEAEKALELQSLRSRNESRAEALQDTVETFTRQKQSQIERLAQGSTAAVRVQSDLEIRKRMEQDRLYRSLAYFVEPLPSPSAYASPQVERQPVAEIRPAVFESAVRFEDTMAAAIDVTPEAPEIVQTGDLDSPEIEAHEAEAAPSATAPSASVGPSADDTHSMSQSGLEMALRAAAQEAKSAGWGQTAIVEDGAADTVDALRKLRDAQKAESEK